MCYSVNAEMKIYEIDWKFNIVTCEPDKNSGTPVCGIRTCLSCGAPTSVWEEGSTTTLRLYSHMLPYEMLLVSFYV